MRFITKLPPTSVGLENAHKSPPADSETARKRWAKFKKHKKHLLRDLMVEQYGLCCYSEARADILGLGFHIEHIVNKSMDPGRTFDYSNLAASAIHSEKIPSLLREQLFGGHSIGKTAEFDESLFISCADRKCQQLFAYLSNGRIVPREGLSQTNHNKADYTINLLNLNSTYLLVERKNRWDELDYELGIYIEKNIHIDELARIELVPTDGKAKAFFSLTRQFLGSAGEKALKNHAPQMR